MKIKKRIFLIPCLLLFLFFCGWRHTFANIGSAAVFIVKSRNIGPYNDVVSSIKDVLQDRNTIKIVEFDFEDKNQVSKLDADIKAGKSTLVITLGTTATKAVRQISDGFTVVYAMILSPQKSDIGPPGVAMDISYEAKLKGIQRIIPDLRNIGVIHSNTYDCEIESLSRVCEKLGLNLVHRKVDSQKEFPGAMDEVFKEADCFLMVADPAVYIPKTTEQLLLEGLQKGIPIIGLSSLYTKAGAFMAFDCDYEDLGKQTAELTFRILNGEKDALGETCLPRKVRFSLNLRVADRLGISLSNELIKEAGEVFGK